MNLIDKDALVAEIERRIFNLEQLWKLGNKKYIETHLTEKFRDIKVYEGIIDFINTLEVKEVDLEKEYKEFVEEDPVYNKLVNGIVGKAIAKHFFELGLKAQKGE